MAKPTQDFYSTLGVSKTADQKEPKKAYRRLARKYHPDLHPGEKKTAMEKKFQELNEAYEVLGDEETRKKYDQYGPNWKEAEAYEHARQQAGGAYPGGQPHPGFSQGGGDFSDIFEHMFSSGGQRSRGCENRPDTTAHRMLYIRPRTIPFSGASLHEKLTKFSCPESAICTILEKTPHFA